RKNEVDKKIAALKDEAEKLKAENDKMRDYVNLLEKRRAEIEQGNVELEARFGKMFQKFNQELNEINKKRNILERVALKKEKDIDEKDQMLFEKITALEESERVLNMRQAELESLEQVLNNMNKEKELLRNDIQKLEDETRDRKNYNHDLKLETEMLYKKRFVLEKSMQELLNLMIESFNKSRERKTKVTAEVREQEEQLQAFREKISDSLREMEQVESSVNSLKIEYEEYRGQVAKFKTMKRKLQDEILK